MGWTRPAPPTGPRTRCWSKVFDVVSSHFAVSPRTLLGTLGRWLRPLIATATPVRKEDDGSSPTDRRGLVRKRSQMRLLQKYTIHTRYYSVINVPPGWVCVCVCVCVSRGLEGPTTLGLKINTPIRSDKSSSLAEPLVLTHTNTHTHTHTHTQVKTAQRYECHGSAEIWSVGCLPGKQISGLVSEVRGQTEAPGREGAVALRPSLSRETTCSFWLNVLSTPAASAVSDGEQQRAPACRVSGPPMSRAFAVPKNGPKVT